MTGLLPLLPLIKDEVERANKAGADLIKRQKKQKEEEEGEAERKRLEDLKKSQGTASTPSTKTQSGKGPAPVAAENNDTGASQLKTPSIVLQYFSYFLSLFLFSLSFICSFSLSLSPSLSPSLSLSLSLSPSLSLPLSLSLSFFAVIIPKSALQRYEELIVKLEKANTQTAAFSKTSDPQVSLPFLSLHALPLIQF